MWFPVVLASQGRQPAGKLKARPHIRFRERRVIPQYLWRGLASRHGSNHIGHQDTRAAHHRFAMTNRGIENNSL